MTKYIKTGTTEFEQFDETEWNRIYHDCGDPDEWEAKASKLGVDRYHGYFVIPTKEGDMKIHDGDWIATGVEGEHWPVKDEIFKRTYKKLPLIPECVGNYIENCKSSKVSISEALASEFRPEKMQTWLGLDEEKMKFIQEQYNQRNELVARAWLDGYEVAEVEE